MKVYFVGVGPGDPDLMTLKASRLLESCEICVYAGSLVNPVVLDLTPESAELHDSAELDLDQITEIFREAKERDVDVVRLHSGDPSIYGAIREQMNRLDSLGIPYEVVPGVSSFQAAAAALNTELTAPEVSQTVILTRTSGRTPMPEGEDLASLARIHATLCVFLSAHKIRDVTSTLKEHYGEDCPAAIVYRATWPDQKIVRSNLRDLADRVEEEGITRTAMIVVGRALSRDIPESKLYDPLFATGYRDSRE